MTNNSSEEIYAARMSVREFVEFTVRSGDLDSGAGRIDPQAMREGVRLHKKLQDMQPEQYTAEHPLSNDVSIEYEGENYRLILDGRADGVMRFGSAIEKFSFDNKELSLYESMCFVDEIKCMYTEIEDFEEPKRVHLAQAKCYAWFLLEKSEEKSIGVQITYCNIDTEKLRYFTYEYERDELREWFLGLVRYYAKWMHWEKHHLKRRDISIKNTGFPFEYRDGQRELVRNVYLSILRSKKIFIEAPTGVGKTISTVFPSMKALSEGLASKIFYTTARTITRTVAEETAGILNNSGMDFLFLTITAKEKLCVCEKPECSPLTCERAKGHEDRVNEAVFDLITHERAISRSTIEEYAKKHNVCPFEFSLDVSLWCDMIICDYNYCFDPDVSLKRFFNDLAAGSYILLVDEAHNLVDRAREMYSAGLDTERIKNVRPLVKDREDTRKLFTRLVNAMKKPLKEAEKPYELNVFDTDSCAKIFGAAGKLHDALKAYVSNRKNVPDEEVVDFFFELRSFVMTSSLLNEDYCITLTENGNNTIIRLNCMNPALRLEEYMLYHRGRAFFSATLLPVRYYMEQLSGSAEDYAVYEPSPFDPKRRRILIANDVSAKFTRRNRDEYEKIVDHIDRLIHAKTGNYLIFFPSYKVMEDIYQVLIEEYGGFEENFDFNLMKQEPLMSEDMREDFLSAFTDEPQISCVGFCVMGGIFSEGIDLKADRLIGVAIVGTGLPMVGPKRELFKDHYDGISNDGFEHAYLWPGMNKVLQAGGRVIRTMEDKGVILLLDERFLGRSYRRLFPKEWEDYSVVNAKSIEDELDSFWNGQK